MESPDQQPLEQKSPSPESIDQPTSLPNDSSTKSPLVHSRTMILFFIGGFFAILILGIVGYTFLIKGKAKIAYQNAPLSSGATIAPSPIPTITHTTQPSRSPTIILSATMSTYLNSTYGFQLLYPSMGFIPDAPPISGSQLTYSYTVGHCGTQIGLNPYVTPTNAMLSEIDIDNFFGIFVNTFNGSLTSYIKQNYPNKNYSYIPIHGSNADEAVSVNLPKNQIPNDNPIAIYRKGTKIFTLAPFQNTPTLNGCELDTTSIFQPNQYPGLTNQEYSDTYNRYYKNWNIPQSFKFIQ
jgi:hypothetical protein